MSIITKFEHFLNESAQDGVLKMYNTVLDILKKSNEKISKSNVCIVKNGKKMKLTSDVIENRRPRYNKGSQTPTPEEQSTASKQIGFIFKCEGLDKPIADYKISVNSANDVSVANNLDAKEEALRFNRMNVKYIPDEIQNKIEKKFGKITTT